MKPLLRWHWSAPKWQDSLAHHAKWVLEMGKSEDEYKKLGFWEREVIPICFDFIWDEEKQTYRVRDKELRLETQLSWEHLANKSFKI